MRDESSNTWSARLLSQPAVIASSHRHHTPIVGSRFRTPASKACYKKKTGTVVLPPSARRASEESDVSRSTARGRKGSAAAKPTRSSWTSLQSVGPPVSPVPKVPLDPRVRQVQPARATGATGPTGPSIQLRPEIAGPVSITGTDSGSANSLVTQSGVSPGNYLLITRVQLNASSTTASEIVCDASLGGKSAQGVANIGTNGGNVAHAVVTTTFNVTVASTSSANLSAIESR